MRIRIHPIVAVPALVIGLVASIPTGAFAQSAEAGSIRRSPTAADRAASPAPGAGPTAFARGEALALPAVVSRQPAASPADFGQPFGTVAQPAPLGGQQRLEQRRSPGAGGGGGNRGGTVRSGGGGGSQGGARVAVPRSSAGYPRGSGGGYRSGGGYYHGGYSNRVVVAPYPYYAYPYYYPYAYSSFYGGGFYDSYWYGGVGFGAGWGPGWGGAYYGGYPAYGAYGRSFDFGRLRLQVQPRDAEVFIDGSYAGKVDDFDGRFQGLQLETGAYKVEIRKPGWETLAFDVRVTPDRTTTYKAEMIPQKP